MLSDQMPSNATPAWPAQAIHAMREWLAECSWRDIEPCEVDDLTTAEVIAGVRRHYSGGLRQFLRDARMLVD